MKSDRERIKVKRILVKTSGLDYPVYIGNSIINKLPELLSRQNLSDRVFALIDKKVYRLYSSEIIAALKRYSTKLFIYPLQAAEETKSLSTTEKIFSALVKEKFGRDTLLLTIGGGTIGDVGGFVASTYMRGIQLVHIPTTIVSAVDSSIGGKTGINFSHRKNLIGTFYQPNEVIVDAKFLNTLNSKERISSFGEVIKYAYLSSKKFYDLLYSNFDELMKLNNQLLEKVFKECISIKAGVVKQDEYESSGIRKILNFGHTFAHAFESYSNYKIEHGRAVAAGIICALYLSHKLKLLSKPQLDYYLQLPAFIKSLKNLYYFRNEELLKYMYSDKKNKKGELNFVLINGIGKIIVDVKADKRDIFYAIERTKEFLGSL